MIYDGFMFFNELDVLEIRLNTLADKVDRFILVESDRTFQGNPKPLFYAENKDRFREFTDRIIHVVVCDFQSKDPWENEFHQRNCIARGIPKDVVDSDIIIVSDADEIADLADLKESPCGWDLDHSYYYVDLLHGSHWPCVMSCTIDHLRRDFEWKPHLLREHRYKIKLSRNGWHFSYLGGPEKIKTKIESFSHTEFLHKNDLMQIKKAIAEDWKLGLDVLGRAATFGRLEDHGTLPPYLLANREKFKHMFCP